MTNTNTTNNTIYSTYLLHLSSTVKGKLRFIVLGGNYGT